MLGPISEKLQRSLPQYQISRFDMIPKGHNTGKWPLITDLSYSLGKNVNDGIEAELCSLVYTSLDQVARATACYPPEALLAKVHIEFAHSPSQCTPWTTHSRLYTLWEGKLCIDVVLPFGVRLAPKLLKRSGRHTGVAPQATRDSTHTLLS